MCKSHFAISNRIAIDSWELGGEVYDTTPDPATELPACSHDIRYLLTCKHAVGRFATARVGSPNRPDFAGHKNRGGERRSHFCGSACARRSDIDRSFVPRATAPGGPHRRAVNLIHEVGWNLPRQRYQNDTTAIRFDHAEGVSSVVKGETVRDPDDNTLHNRCDVTRRNSWQRLQSVSCGTDNDRRSPWTVL